MKKDFIIQNQWSIIPACDVPLDKFEEIVQETSDVERVGAYKIGFELGLKHGLPRVVDTARKYTDKPIIYDHQKAGTDVPHTGKNFSKVIKDSGVDAVILFPQAGPETQRAWIESALEQELGVIVGGLMTHPKYLKSEGGYIDDDAVEEIYTNASKLGVRNFVIPGTRLQDARRIAEIQESHLGACNFPTFFLPGFGAQGASVAEASDRLVDSQEVRFRWHGIVGRGIYEAENIRGATMSYTSQLPSNTF